MVDDVSEKVEDVEHFRVRARKWIDQNMPRLPDAGVGADDSWDRQRDLQRKLWEGGFAGIRFPRSYGGLGLGAAHQAAFNDEAEGFEMPTRLNVPTFGILAATLLDCGTEEQKQRHIPAILSGEEVWVQFLSEPSGGSDLAGSLMKAERDGDAWVLNGSKIWSSGAADADYALCLARSNWDVPKHRGLTMFIVKIHQPGIRVEQIRQINGSREFCQEFFDDVVLLSDSVVGEVNDGWSVALRLLAHERVAAGGASPFANGVFVAPMSPRPRHPLHRETEEADEAASEDRRQGFAQERVISMVYESLVERVSKGLQIGVLPSAAGAMLKLFSGIKGRERAEANLVAGGISAVTWRSEDPNFRSPGEEFLWCLNGSIAGGTNEMQRNIISERLLGMPREWAADRDVPFRDVRKNLSR